MNGTIAREPLLLPQLNGKAIFIRIERQKREMISVSWFGPASEVNFGPLGISFVGFVDGATEAELADQERQGGVV
jgi:hypothetical protein